MFTKEKINDYADKLLIGLSEEECETLLDEFDVINENMGLIEKIPNLKDVEPMSFPVDIKITSLREDKPDASLPIEDILKNSDDTIERYIEVPKVVG